ncbi:MAG: phosphocholine cytidylyltransferase family protein [Pseudomonadota bacterium]
MIHSDRPIAILLLAGIGSRLGKPHPKSMTPLNNGETIISRALRILRERDLNILGIVGFKMELVMEFAPDIYFAYNPRYDTTNTAKSLLAGLHQIDDQDVLWLNGDVVFEGEIIDRVLAADGSAVAVNNARVSDEEVKYTLDGNGFINAISKEVRGGLGEAIGINLVRANHLSAFKSKLEEVGDNDYFERAMELLIEERGPTFRAADVSDLNCIEIDFDEDLEAARKMLND